MPKSNIHKTIIDTPRASISWEDDADRLIIYADIMGFSHRVINETHYNLKQ